MSVVMPDQVTVRPADRDRSKSGVVGLDRWYCDGADKTGRRCGQVLMEVCLTVGSVVRVRCHKCGTFHTLQVKASLAS